MEETWTCCAKVREDEEDMVGAQEPRLVDGGDDGGGGAVNDRQRWGRGVYMRVRGERENTGPIWSRRDGIVDGR